MKVIGLTALSLCALVASAADYLVVAHQSVEKAKIEAICARHSELKPEVVVYQDDVTEAFSQMKAHHPRYICFMPDERNAGRKFVAQVHQMTRKLDDDPYTDALWGIVVGVDAKQIESWPKSLTIRNTSGNTYLYEPAMESYTLFSELVKGEVLTPQGRKKGESQELALQITKLLAENQVDMLVTSAHAREVDWLPGYSFNGGLFQMDNGVLSAHSIDRKQKVTVQSTNPKVMLACGNCLMGHFNHPTNCMIAGWQKQANVCQLIGYTVSTWFGYGGWGVVDYFVEQPGRFTFAEAFFANHQALLEHLRTQIDDRGRPAPRLEGFRYDCDTVAFYGDPAMEVKMADKSKNWEQTLTVEGEVVTFKIKPLKGNQTFQPVNTNGSKRGYRPVFCFLPKRILKHEVIRSDIPAVITDDFIMVRIPQGEIREEYVIQFKEINETK